MAYVLMGTFNTLYEKGYCKKDEEEPQEGDTEEWISGTGMSEGKGERDISDKIEDEDDLVGAKEV